MFVPLVLVVDFLLQGHHHALIVKQVNSLLQHQAFVVHARKGVMLQFLDRLLARVAREGRRAEPIRPRPHPRALVALRVSTPPVTLATVCSAPAADIQTSRGLPYAQLALPEIIVRRVPQLLSCVSGHSSALSAHLGLSLHPQRHRVP